MVNLAIGDFDDAVLPTLQSRTKTLFGSDTAIQENRCNIAQEERVPRLGRNLTALRRSDSDQRALIPCQSLPSDSLRGIEICPFVVYSYNSISMRFAGKHAHPRQDSFHLPPFHCKSEHSSQDLKLTVDRGDLHARILPAPGVARDLLARDRVERFVCDGRILQ